MPQISSWVFCTFQSELHNPETHIAKSQIQPHVLEICSHTNLIRKYLFLSSCPKKKKSQIPTWVNYLKSSSILRPVTEKKNKIIGVVRLIIRVLIKLYELKRELTASFFSHWMGLRGRERWTGDYGLFKATFVDCGPVLSRGKGTSGTVVRWI